MAGPNGLIQRLIGTFGSKAKKSESDRAFTEGVVKLQGFAVDDSKLPTSSVEGARINLSGNRSIISGPINNLSNNVNRPILPVPSYMQTGGRQILSGPVSNGVPNVISGQVWNSGQAAQAKNLYPFANANIHTTPSAPLFSTSAPQSPFPRVGGGAASAIQSNGSIDKLNSTIERLSQTLIELNNNIKKKDGGDDDRHLSFKERMEKKATTKFGPVGGAAFMGAADFLINQVPQAVIGYKKEMATAPVETYSNIATLQGFQQKRFLRDFGDFSAESRVLRNQNLLSDQARARTPSLAKIDKLSSETARKKDEAEKLEQTYLTTKNILGAGLLAGAAVVGAGSAGLLSPVSAMMGTAAIGMLTAGGAALASAPTNPVMMRTEAAKGLVGDLYLKNKTAFDTQNIMQNTQAMENAVLEMNRIEINNMKQYESTLPTRNAARNLGRFTDILGQATDVENFFSFQNKGPASQRMKQIYEQNRAEKSPSLRGVLEKYGYAAGDEEAVNIMSAFGRIGGAGAGAVRNDSSSGKALDVFRRMSESGLGPMQQLIGQAGMIGRISGGVGQVGNTEKFRELMARAVSEGLDDSDLSSAFIQNVAQTAERMGTTNVGEVGRMLQNMLAAGGGQLVDLKRMQGSMAGLEQVRQQNLNLQTNTRENLAAFLNAEGGKFFNTKDTRQAANVFSAMNKIGIQQIPMLKSAAGIAAELAEAQDKYNAVDPRDKKAKASAKAAMENAQRKFDGLDEKTRDFFLTLSPEERKKFAKQPQLVNKMMESVIAGMGGTNEAGMRKAFGGKTLQEVLSMKDVSKRDELIRNFAVQTQERKGGSASQMVDLFKLLIEGVDRDQKGGATKKASVDAAERDKENKRKEAETKNAQAQVGAKGKMSMLQNMASAEGGFVGQSDFILGQYGLKLDGGPEANKIKKQKFQKYVDIKRFQGKKSEKDLQKDYKAAGIDLSEIEEFEQTRKKLQETTVDQTDQPNLAKPPEERPGGLTAENAKEIGKAFAEEFFNEAEKRAKKNAEQLKDNNSNKGNFTGGYNFGMGAFK